MEKIINFVKQELQKYTDNILEDGLGGVFGVLEGNGPTIMFCGHMDEVGYMVSGITPKGMVKLLPIGGMNPEVYLSQNMHIVINKEKTINLNGMDGSFEFQTFNSKHETNQSGISTVVNTYLNYDSTDVFVINKYISEEETNGSGIIMNCGGGITLYSFDKDKNSDTRLNLTYKSLAFSDGLNLTPNEITFSNGSSFGLDNNYNLMLKPNGQFVNFGENIYLNAEENLVCSNNSLSIPDVAGAGINL